MATHIFLRLEPSAGKGDVLGLSALGEYLGDLASALTALSVRENSDLAGVLDWEVVRARAESPLELALAPTAIREDAVLPPPDDLIEPIEDDLGSIRAALEPLEGHRPRLRVGEPTLKAAMSIIRAIAEDQFGRVTLMVERDGERTPVLDATSQRSRMWVEEMEAILARTAPQVPEWREFGSLIGRMTKVSPHYNKPAFLMRDMLTGAEVRCLIPYELAAEIGSSHTLDEVWSEARLLVAGEIRRTSDGTPKTVIVSEIRKLDDNADADALIQAIPRQDVGIDDAWGDRAWGVD